MSNILVALVQSGWNEGWREDALSPKTVLDNKKNLEEKPPVTNVDL